MTEFRRLIAQLDPDPGLKGRQFERICRWFLLNAPEHRGRFKDVWLWQDWPGAWGPDAGIDLVAQEKSGECWAIQAKAYDTEYAIKKADVDSFLSESSRSAFSYRLLIATTDRLGANAKRTLDAQREPVGYLLRSQLELAPVAWPGAPDDLRPSRPVPKKPLPHVKTAVKAVVNGFKASDRGQLIMACGTGKTLAALWIAERLNSNRTLVLVPSLSLLAQTLREWTANASSDFEYLAVCSDETVVGEDELVQHTAELGLPVTTEPKDISKFLRGRGRRVVFATYHSSPRIASAFGPRVPKFDLAVADEAHRCAGRVATEFATILNAKLIRSRRRLFMTATPRYYTPRVLREAGVLDVEVASMDDETRFGPVLHRLSFGEAIQRDLLSDYQVVVVGVDDQTYQSYARRGELVTRDDKTLTDARTLAGQIGLAKSMRRYDLQRVISFHGRIKAARDFSHEMQAVIAWMPARQRPPGPLWSEHINGAMSSGQRDRLLMRFRHLEPPERGLLTNARCLAEGVDVPTIDGVAFIDPRRSSIDIVQAVGRAIRKTPDRKVGTIVIPVFVNSDEEVEDALEDSTFQQVWDVLKALRSHDEALGKELDELRLRLGARRSPVSRPGKIKLDIPVERVGAEFAKAFDVRLVEQTTAAWEFSYGRLVAYVEREGHARVESEYRDDDGYRLGSWVAVQRTASRSGGLSEERRERLDALTGWVWSTQEADWEKGYARLAAFIKREGHARVLRPDDDKDGYRLGNWVENQRGFQRRGQLSAQRARRLEALPGWTWSTRRVQQMDWADAFARLESFVDREGHSRVPSPYRDEDGYRLGRWVVRHRGLGREGKLSAARKRRFDALPTWSWGGDETWEDGYARLQRFFQREGHARVPSEYRDDAGWRLGGWVKRQRTARRQGHLPNDQATRLEELAGWTWGSQVDRREMTWDETYARLVGFVERESHARVPAAFRDDDGFRLGSWVAHQRHLGRSGVLSKGRTDRLEALPGWAWSPLDADWEEAYGRLIGFAEREGHTRVPSSFRDEGLDLRAWISRQRQAHRKGKLAGERVRRLEAVRGWAWEADGFGRRPGEPLEKENQAWEDGYARLGRFVEREGHSRVPTAYREKDGYRLGSWVHIQRQSRRRGELSEERARRLEALPNWAWAERGAKWEDAYDRLLAFIEREGHSRPPSKYRDEDGYPLGMWVVRQRSTRRTGDLSTERSQRLAALPGWTWDDRIQ